MTGSGDETMSRQLLLKAPVCSNRSVVRWWNIWTHPPSFLYLSKYPTNVTQWLAGSAEGWKFALFRSLQNVLCLLQYECFQLVRFLRFNTFGVMAVGRHLTWTGYSCSIEYWWMEFAQRELIMDWQEESDICWNQSHHCLGVRQLFLKTTSYLAWRSCWVRKFVSKVRFPHIGVKKNHNHSLGLNHCPNMTKHHSDLQRPSTKMSF